MCSRFEVNASSRDLTRRYGFNDLPTDFTTGEVRPTDPALMIAAGGPRVMRWGLSVDWNNKPLINARAETLAEKSTFRPLLKNRCLVLATAYFEWRRDGGQRFKNRIAPNDGATTAFAGLHDEERFVIITCEPASDIAHIHNRMPVMLGVGEALQWIDASLGFENVGSLLVPSANGALVATEAMTASSTQSNRLGS